MIDDERSGISSLIPLASFATLGEGRRVCSWASFLPPFESGNIRGLFGNVLSLAYARKYSNEFL